MVQIDKKFNFDVLLDKARKGDEKAQEIVLRCYWEGGPKENFEEALNWAKILLAKKNVLGIRSIARANFFGICGDKDKAKANELFSMLLNERQLNPTVCPDLARMFLREKKPREAFRVLNVGVSQGSLACMEQTAAHLSYGYLHDGDELEAYEVTRVLASKCPLLGNFYLGRCYLFGKGVDCDEKKGIELIKQAADLGNAVAQLYLAVAYQKGLFSLPIDEKLAFEYAKKSATQEYCKAQYALATFYLWGIGVEKDITEAKRLLKSVAQRGYGTAQASYAAIIFGDANSTASEIQDAITFLQRATEKNNIGALRYLIYLYENGLDGYIEQDADKSYELARQLEEVLKAK